MQPILFTWQIIRIYSFGFLALLGFVAASFYVWQQSRELGWEEESAMDKLVASTLAALAMARLVYVLAYQSKFESWGQVFGLVSRPGLSWWGAWLGGGLALWFLTVREFRQRGRYFDVFAVAAVIWGVFLSVGCWLNGCVTGRELPGWLAASWPKFLLAEYPVGEYLILSSLLILLVVYRVYSRIKKYRWYHSKKDGFVAGLAVLLAALQRAVLEIFVLDRLYWWRLNVAWLVSGLVGLAALAFMFYIAGCRPDWRAVIDKFSKDETV